MLVGGVSTGDKLFRVELGVVILTMLGDGLLAFGEGLCSLLLLRKGEVTKSTIMPGKDFFLGERWFGDLLLAGDCRAVIEEFLFN